MNQFLALAGAFAPPAPPATSPPPPPPPAATAPAVPGACPCGNRGACATPPPPASPPAAPPAAPPAPRAWQLADVAGQTWTHADKATLEAYVAARNAALARPTFYQAAPPPSYSRCGPRGCR